MYPLPPFWVISLDARAHAEFVAWRSSRSVAFDRASIVRGRRRALCSDVEVGRAHAVPRLSLPLDRRHGRRSRWSRDDAHLRRLRGWSTGVVPPDWDVVNFSRCSTLALSVGESRCMPPFDACGTTARSSVRDRPVCTRPHPPAGLLRPASPRQVSSASASRSGSAATSCPAAS